jgi:hypothetical protein
MRYNAFGDRYCSNDLEIVESLELADCEPDEVYLAPVNGPEGDETMWEGEVCENSSGEIVCYIEAATEAEVIEMARLAGVKPA